MIIRVNWLEQHFLQSDETCFGGSVSLQILTTASRSRRNKQDEVDPAKASELRADAPTMARTKQH
jgi:hypothetical protein